MAGALAPAILKPRGESIFSPPQYFPRFLHAVFFKLPVVTYLVFYCEMHDNKTNTQAHPNHKACLCHKQHGKLLRELWLAANGPFNNYVTLFCSKTDPTYPPLSHTVMFGILPNNYVTTHDPPPSFEFIRRQVFEIHAKNIASSSNDLQGGTGSPIRNILHFHAGVTV